MAVIELGIAGSETPVSPGPPSTMTRIRRWRMTALILCALLLSAATGSAPTPPPELVSAGAVATGPDAHYLLTTDRLYVSMLAPGRTGRQLSAHRLRDGHRLWQIQQPDGTNGPVQLRVVGDLLLLTYIRTDGQLWTVAVAQATGGLRWSVPSMMDTRPGSPVGLAVRWLFEEPDEPTDHRVGNRRVEESISGWRIGGSTRDRLTATGPVGVSAVDLVTGQRLWTEPRLAHVGWAAGGGADPGLLVIPERGPVEVWDARDRAVRHRLDVPGGRLMVVNDLLLWQADPTADVTAYRTTDLVRLWSRPAPRPEDSLTGCVFLLCQHRPAEDDAIDPATGAVLWSAPMPHVLGEQAGHLIVMRDASRAVQTLDRRTGQPLLDLGGWLIGTPQGTGVPLVLNRSVPAETTARTWLAVLEPGATRIRVLDTVPYWVVACQAAPSHYLICQTRPDEVRIWRYRPATR